MASIMEQECCSPDAGTVLQSQDHSRKGHEKEDTQPLVSMRGIHKKYGAIIANEDVELDLYAGEIHVLLGENGAGKTTLMNILFGHAQPDSGDVYIAGKPVEIGDPLVALQHRIGMVHQHFNLVEAFTVAENVLLGAHSAMGPLRSARIETTVGSLADRLAIPIKPSALIRDLPVEQRQQVEILKALHRGSSVLIMDEPTALLGPQQIGNLLDLLERLRNEGHAIVLVTHKLAEVMRVADRVTVLRAGRNVGMVKRGSFNEQDLALAMTGHKLPEVQKIERAPGGSAVMRLRNLTVNGRDRMTRLTGVDLDVLPGEVVGIAGVEGNGQQILVDVICGIIMPDRGSIFINQTDVTLARPAERRSAGLSTIHQDRRNWGLALDLTVAENIALSDIPAGRLSKFGMVKRGALQDHARQLLQKYDVRPPDPSLRASDLSGGNQQKIVLARELQTGTKVLVAHNPTWGLDLGAVDYLHKRLEKACATGTGVLLLSNDVDEFLKLSNRVAVIYRGEIVLRSPVADLDMNAMAAAMAGQYAGAGECTP